MALGDSPSLQPFIQSGLVRAVFKDQRLANPVEARTDTESIQSVHARTYVSVNSNWVHPPGDPREKFSVQIFYLENLTKPLYFRLKQNHSKVFKYSNLDIQLKQ